MIFRRRTLAAALVGIVAAGTALAQQEEGADEGGRFVNFIEGLLSNDDRQVNIQGMSGTFSSSPTIERITVSDSDGVWLEIDNLAVEWTRSALFRRVLDIQSLSADSVQFLRSPVSPEDEVPEEGGGSFSLPVDVSIDSFSLPDIVLGEALTGVAANLSAEGSAEIDDDTIALNLDLERLDAPGGSVNAAIELQPAQNVLTADLTASEPAGGLLSDLLGIPGQPALEIALDGSGPLGDWSGDLSASAAGEQILDGTVGIAAVDDGFHFTGDLAGDLDGVVPPDYAALVAGQTALDFDVIRDNAGALDIRSARLSSEGARLSASGAIGSDLVPRSGEVSGEIGLAGRTTLPFVPGNLSVERLALDAALKEDETASWTVNAAADAVASDQGRLANLRLEASGEASDLGSPGERATSFTVEGTVTGIEAADPGLDRAIGDTVELASTGRWEAGQPVTFETLDLDLDGSDASFAGTATTKTLEGEYSLSSSDLSRFSGVAGRELSGRAAANFNGRIVPMDGVFDLMVNAVGVDLALGIDALTPILDGESNLVGGVSRDGDGLRFQDLRLETPEAVATVNGTYADPEVDLAVEAEIADLGAVTERAEGRLTVQANVTGTTNAPRVDAEAAGDELVLMGREFANAQAEFSGVVAGPETNGTASLAGSLGGVPVEGSAELAAGDDGARLLRDLVVSVGESRATGDLRIGADNLLDGEVAIVSPDLSVVAPLFLAEASGSLQAGLTLTSNGGQNARFAASANDLVYETISVGAAEVNGTASDLFAAPKIDGSFTVRDLSAGGLQVVRAEGTATRTGETTDFAVEADLADGSASLAGSLDPQPGGLAVRLDRFAFSRPGADLALASPTTIAVTDGTANLDNLTITVSGGRIVVDGSAGSNLDLDVALRDVPAALVNSFAPDLDAEGAISGTADVTGPASDPQVAFDLGWQGASLSATRNAGLGPLAIDADGTYQDGTVSLSTGITGPSGIDVAVNGSVATAGAGNLDLDVTGTVPLSLGNVQLADRGAALSGALTLDVAVSGPLSSPNYSGTITSSGGTFIDPETGIVLNDLALDASLSGNQIAINRLTARSGDGTVRAGGTIGLDPAAGLPVDLTLDVTDARYVDGSLVAATFSADLAITGGLISGSTIAGTVDVERAEITVPERLPQGSVAVDVLHLYEPPDVARTLARAEYGDTSSGDDSPGGEPSGVNLDITLNAPNQIFVRGRGLDAELGGELSLTGPVSDIVATGAFEMIRGRFDILTQRITFDRGIISFAGDLDPILDFSGTTRSGDVTITVSVTGRASDPEVSFSSTPELPEDEVLAYLLFNRSLDDLSPFQLAQLAAAVAQFAGGSSGPGLLDQIRAATGLDDLDIVTDETGGTALQAGRYLGENLYLGVQQGVDTGSTRVTIELQVTDEVKARAGVSQDGGSSIGIFYEREY